MKTSTGLTIKNKRTRIEVFSLKLHNDVNYDMPIDVVNHIAKNQLRVQSVAIPQNRKGINDWFQNFQGWMF